MEKKVNEYVDFVVTARRYKTLLTDKYKHRPVWNKPVQGEVFSTLPGTIIELKVKEGDQVKAGQLLLIHEAMKMLNRIVAPVSGVIQKINVKEGEKISKNHLMIKIDPK
ncbi:acetyl-CoA carboxylase biotin carboxyl carrier protein subunit [Parabacteroides sp. PF5-9]|uniref:acetyl-CoA carboxylase biotin carboxyl carrier protein subunit n=1 Tax=Parabacteroides sp. PF5-9 TaxID=1742404 RepID=UPI0024735CFA|nr:acetyl-CoA carboxylase biotin carboxyl carrier protein subunit [Parabacteroides sp. PF5-9]MDH6358546.1 biotin carboxyl carrier protein [Parabacteroides sp. PF5-9]